MKKVLITLVPIMLFLSIVASPTFAAGLNVKAVYSFWNPYAADHIVTSDVGEINNLSRIPQWNNYGFQWYATANDGQPVYRLWNPVIGKHHYTLDQNEVHVLCTQYGWYSDNNGAPVFYSKGDRPIYRLYSPSYGYHFFTPDKAYYDSQNGNGFFIGEGIAFYGY